jgi:hypothetical protein
MFISHLNSQVKSYDGLLIRDRRTFYTQNGEAIEFRSEYVPGLLRHLTVRGADRDQADRIARQIGLDARLEENLFHLAKDRSFDAGLEALENAIAFFGKYPSWWDQAVEARLESLADNCRGHIQDQWDLTQFDIAVGITKGTYQFGKEMVVGIADLFRLAYLLATDSGTQAKSLELLGQWSSFSYKLYFGTAKQKSEALNAVKQLGEMLIEQISQSIQSDWEKAVAEGKQTELAAKWLTLGVLEVGTLVLAAAKGIKAAQAAAEAARVSATTSSAAKQLGEALKLLAPRYASRRTSYALGKKLFPGRSDYFYREFAKVKGAVIGKYDIAAPGPLGEAAETFSGYRYVVIVLERPLRTFRAWAPATWSIEMGGYWGLTRAKSSLQAAIDNALRPEWGKLVKAPWFRSQATRLTQIEIPVGTRIALGESGNQVGMRLVKGKWIDAPGPWVGGKVQLLLLDGVKDEWFKRGGVLK